MRLSPGKITSWFGPLLTAALLMAAFWVAMAPLVARATPSDGFHKIVPSAPSPSSGTGQVTPTYAVAPPYTPPQLAGLQAAPALVVTKTVGTEKNTCAPTHAITVTAGTEVVYCYFVLNTGPITLTRHIVEDDQLGTLLSNYALTLTPQTADKPAALFTLPEIVTATVTNVVTWTGFSDDDLAAANTSAATVHVVSIDITKTVGLQPDVCATTSVITASQGTDVYYCYEIANRSATRLVRHTLIDSATGLILNNLNYPLDPGERFNTVAAGYVVTDTAPPAETSVATWTAYTVGGLAPQETASTRVRIPAISMAKTVGVDSTQCATSTAVSVISGSDVFNCYRVRNTGSVTFRMHTVADSAQGVLLNHEPFLLEPNMSVFFTTTQRLTTSLTSAVTWTASTQSDGSPPTSDIFTATAQSGATVTVIPGATFIVIVFVDNDGNGLQRGAEPGLPDARVTLQSQNGALSHQMTDEDGRVRFEGLAPGSYTITVEATWPEGTVEGTTENNPLHVELAAGEQKSASFGFKIPFRVLLPLVTR